MGFLRHYEERMALHYLTWQYQKRNLPVPPLADLKSDAAQIVAEAHRIAAERGRNVAAIIKELVQEIKKR
jgi:hypothetical protein